MVSNSLKVLHCITGLTGDGAQRMLLRLAQGLKGYGIQSEVFNLSHTTPVADAFEESGIPVRSLGLSPRLDHLLRAARSLRQVMQETQPSIVQGWMYHANVVTLAALQRGTRRVPVLWNIRRALDDYHERRLLTRLVIRSNAWLSALPSRIVYCSLECQVQHEAAGFSRDRGLVLQNGFDTGRFAPSAPARSRFRSRHKVADDEFLIGMVGRYDLAKGHSYLLEAFCRVAPRLPKARLILVGRGMDDRNREVAAILSKANVRDRVLLLGEQSHIEGVYPGLDLYCSSSLNEGFPNALSEAMSCGVPCIATDTGASRELVEGVGIVTRSRRADELAEGIVAMASMDPVELQSRAERSRERIVSRYALDRIVREYCDLYSTLASGSEKSDTY